MAAAAAASAPVVANRAAVPTPAEALEAIVQLKQQGKVSSERERLEQEKAAAAAERKRFAEDKRLQHERRAAERKARDLREQAELAARQRELQEERERREREQAKARAMGEGKEAVVAAASAASASAAMPCEACKKPVYAADAQVRMLCVMLWLMGCLP